MNVLPRRAHATGGRSVSTQLAPTSARGTLLTVVEDTTLMKRAHAVLVRLKKTHHSYITKHITNLARVHIMVLSVACIPPLQILMSAKALKRFVQAMVVSTCWAPSAVSVRLATSSTASVGLVRVSDFVLLLV